MKATTLFTPFWGAMFLGVWLVIPSMCSNVKQAEPLPCLRAANLDELMSCIQKYTPSADTDGYHPPRKAVQRAWRRLVRRMLAGDCEASMGLSSDLRTSYQLSPFTDGEDGQSYCVLMEIADQVPRFPQVDRGWGTLIVNPQARTNLHIQVPHPQYEWGTAWQGIEVFKALQASSFLMAGTHRNANARRSPCQPRHGEADVGHNADTLFQVATEVLWSMDRKAGSEAVMLQFHGLSNFDCKGVDVFMTYGNRTPPEPGDALLTLRDHLARQNASWTVRVPGETPFCGLHGSANIQGRLWNSVAPQQVCTTPATTLSKRFIYVEQAPGPYRDAANWIDALRAALPPS